MKQTNLVLGRSDDGFGNLGTDLTDWKQTINGMAKGKNGERRTSFNPRV